MLDYSKGMSCNDSIVITRKPDDAITAPSAAALADITYRQLDYWARRGWVTPSVGLGRGRSGRRLYGAQDVIKLAALGHFGRSGADVGSLGPKLCNLNLASEMGDYVLVATGGDVLAVEASKLRAALAEPGTYSVFDPAQLRARMQSAAPETELEARRSA